MKERNPEKKKTVVDKRNVEAISRFVRSIYQAAMPVANRSPMRSRSTGIEFGYGSSVTAWYAVIPSNQIPRKRKYDAYKILANLDL
jgi:hypothetical protein